MKLNHISKVLIPTNRLSLNLRSVALLLLSLGKQVQGSCPQVGPPSGTLGTVPPKQSNNTFTTKARNDSCSIVSLNEEYAQISGIYIIYWNSDNLLDTGVPIIFDKNTSCQLTDRAGENEIYTNHKQVQLGYHHLTLENRLLELSQLTLTLNNSFSKDFVDFALRDDNNGTNTTKSSLWFFAADRYVGLICEDSFKLLLNLDVIPSAQPTTTPTGLPSAPVSLLPTTIETLKSKNERLKPIQILGIVLGSLGVTLGLSLYASHKTHKPSPLPISRPNRPSKETQRRNELTPKVFTLVQIDSETDIEEGTSAEAIELQTSNNPDPDLYEAIVYKVRQKNVRYSNNEGFKTWGDFMFGEKIYITARKQQDPLGINTKIFNIEDSFESINLKGQTINFNECLYKVESSETLSVDSVVLKQPDDAPHDACYE